MSRTGHRVAVIGGGITGLAAAHALSIAGTEVVVFEADHRFGGKLRTSPFAGREAIDEGPDAFLARLPWATDLARTVGLGDELTSPAAASAALWMHRLHPIPGGLLLGMPTGAAALARSRLLSWRGKVRAALEPVLPRTPTDHDSLGGYVRARFGREVHERLVDPLVGSIYAADTDRFSLAAVPQIADLATGSRSVLVASRARPATSAADGPVFYAPRGGLGSFASAVADAATAAGARLVSGCTVEALHAGPDGAWLVDIGHSSHTEIDVAFDGVVLAAPARDAARMVGGIAPSATSVLHRIEAADVVIVTLAIDAAQWPTRLTGMSGYLVPKPVQRLVTAVSFGSQKWAHWADHRTVVLRVSLGRDGLPVLHLSDDELVAAAVSEVGHHLGVALRPTDVRLTRWPGAFPQYRPHHAALVADAQAALPPTIRLAGASYHGIGIPACIRSAQQAAASLSQSVEGMAQ